MSNFSDKVKIQHRLNKLKLKAGIAIDDERHGHIDPKAIKKAQQAIDKGEESYSDEVEIVLVKLDSAWSDLKKQKDAAKIKTHKSELYNNANNVKDMAETFHYKLMQHFGESLRDFCEKLDVAKEEHHTIVQAHIDVMWIAFKNNIKDEGGAQGKELQKMLVTAIEKYS